MLWESAEAFFIICEKLLGSLEKRTSDNLSKAPCFESHDKAIEDWFVKIWNLVSVGARLMKSSLNSKALFKPIWPAVTSPDILRELSIYSKVPSTGLNWSLRIGCAKAKMIKNMKSNLEPNTNKCFKLVLLPVSFLSSSMNKILGKITFITFLNENKWIKTGISSNNKPQSTDGYKNVIGYKFMLEYTKDQHI